MGRLRWVELRKKASKAEPSNLLGFFRRGDQLLEELLARNEVGPLGLGERVAGDERKRGAERCEDDSEPRTAV